MGTEPLRILDVDAETGICVDREITDSDLDGWPADALGNNPDVQHPA